jgi:hypothetical protein
MVGGQCRQLPVPVGGIHHISINDGHLADTTPGNEFSSKRPNATQSHHHHVLRCQVPEFFFANQQFSTGEPGDIHEVEGVEEVEANLDIASQKSLNCKQNEF